MTPMSITLYFAPGTRATRIAFLLEELGVPWHKVTLDLAQREHKAPAYLAINPNGVVPALKDGDTVIFESVAIALYLADRYTQKGLAPPPDSPLRGRYLSWMVWSMTTLEPPIGDVYLERLKPAEQQSAAAIGRCHGTVPGVRRRSWRANSSAPTCSATRSRPPT